MEQINFISISIRNFLSVGEVPVEFEFQNGLNLITGANLDLPERSNGVGKSTVVDAFFYALFGETVRGLKKGGINCFLTKKPAVVELLLEKGGTHYKIWRANEKTQKVEIFVNGENKTLSTVSENNNWIERILGGSKTSFLNTVVLSINGTIPFLMQGAQERRRFIDSILNLGFFEKILAESRSTILDLQKSQISKKRSLDEKNSSIQFLKTQIQTQDELFSKFESAKKLKLGEIEARLNLSKNNLESYNLELDRLRNKVLEKYPSGERKINTSEKEEKISQLRKLQLRLNGELAKNAEQLKSAQKIEKLCPWCGKDVSGQKSDESLIAQLKETQQKNKKLLDNVEKSLVLLEAQIKEDWQKIDLENKEYFEMSQNIRMLSVQISNENRNISSFETEWKAEREKTFDPSSLSAFRQRLEETEISKKSLEEEIKKEYEKILIYEKIKIIFSEEGVKAFFVNQMIGNLNNRINYYLQRLDSPARIVFDSNFEESLTNQSGNDAAYENFSGAEKRTVDLACMFAFSDMKTVNGGINTNVSFYDELLDSSFDSNGVRMVLKILQERSGSNCVYVISHRPDAIKDVGGKVLFLEKKSGITKLKSYS